MRIRRSLCHTHSHTHAERGGEHMTRSASRLQAGFFALLCIALLHSVRPVFMQLFLIKVIRVELWRLGSAAETSARKLFIKRQHESRTESNADAMKVNARYARLVCRACVSLTRTVTLFGLMFMRTGRVFRACILAFLAVTKTSCEWESVVVAAAVQERAKC